MLDQIINHLGENSVIIFSVILGGFAGMAVERWHKKLNFSGWSRSRSHFPKRKWKPRILETNQTESENFDPASQLRLVTTSVFKARRLLNASEARLFSALEKAVFNEMPNWRVMAQVSLGEILSSPDKEAYRAINSKRVDLLLVDAKGNPLHAIEYQGSGHHQGTAAVRDAIKKEALRRAGVGYIEVVPGDTPAEVRQMVRKLAGK